MTSTYTTVCAKNKTSESFCDAVLFLSEITSYTFPMSFSFSQRLLPSAFLMPLLLEAAQGNLDAVLFGLLCSCSNFEKNHCLSTIPELGFLCKSRVANNFASWQSIRRTCTIARSSAVTNQTENPEDSEGCVSKGTDFTTTTRDSVQLSK